MLKNAFTAGLLGALLLAGAIDCHAEKWVKNNVDVPNQNVDANYFDGDSVKGHEKTKTLSWTEKFVMTPFGEKSYTKHLSQYPECQKSIEKKGSVAFHQIDFEIKEGKWRMVAKRNYSKDKKLLCTDKDMGTELDKSWYEVEYKSPMYERYYIFVTKYKLGNF
jgi:hypothetical protein